ncbi:radical SAM protein [Streptomyces sp. KM273126]|uniref:radical SAM protein n=1 Tax=Streptomyces sp. KM273126 TaxID=2545247 RepID=UPI001C664644|nr:radical SAM protein [Streptomyces sp. KM273126]
MSAPVIAPTVEKTPGTPQFLWLDLTRQCQLKCSHCHNGSGPDGTHGTMTADDWTRVLDESAAAGIPHVQFTGGEVTMHPDAPTLIEHALTLGLKVEVYSNLVHVTAAGGSCFGNRASAWPPRTTAGKPNTTQSRGGPVTPGPERTSCGRWSTASRCGFP